MNNFVKKNHEEQSSKILARLFALHCINNGFSFIGSVFVKLKNNYEKKHGNGRPNYQSDNRCDHFNTLFYERCYRNIGASTFGSCRGVCAYKLNQFLSTLCALWPEDMSYEKGIKNPTVNS